MRPVLSPTPAGLAHPHPVRRTQARARVLGLVDEGLQQPGPVAAEALEVFPHRPRRPAQHNERPGCGRQRRDESETGTAPPLGAGGRVGPRRPSRPRCRGPSGAGRMPRTRCRPANRARSRPDSAVDGRRTAPHRGGARVPSVYSRPDAARRSRPEPAPGPGACRPRQAHRAPTPQGARAPAACAPRRSGVAAGAARYGPSPSPLAWLASGDVADLHVPSV